MGDSNRLIYKSESSCVPPEGIDNRPRIAIVMINSKGVPKYGHFTAMNNYLYASKQNYDFIVEKQPQDIEHDWTWDSMNQYVIVWYKAELLKRHLKNYHYVLYIDSDAYVSNIEYRIEDILIPYMKDDLCILFQEDKWQQSIALRQNNEVTSDICAGLIFIKNCQKAFDILDLWSRAPYENPDCFGFRYKHAREQDCIIHLRKTYNLEKYINIYPCIYGMFGQYDSKWIVHLGAINLNDRNTVTQQVFKHNYNSYLFETESKTEATSAD
jgi:hypothetical protein